MNLGNPYVFVFSVLCVVMVLRVSLCVLMTSAVPRFLQFHIITPSTVPNSSAAPFKANAFSSNLQIHLAFCVNDISGSFSQRNCCGSSWGFVLSIWQWNAPHLIIYCSISEMTAAASMWRKLADGQLWLAGNKFSTSNFRKGVISQIEFEVMLCF